MAEHRHARRRNILVFVVGVLFLANLFGFYFHATDALGGLGFIVSPILLALALRAFAGDGWADAGFGLRACGNIDVYGIAILLFPALMVGAIGLGVVTGGITILPGAGVALIATMATSLSLIFLFAFFEEAGWRGYLEPRLGAPGPGLGRRPCRLLAVTSSLH
ncbi:MAG: hypothetical protein WBD34_21085 [Burkholderiaceae bacterium]